MVQSDSNQFRSVVSAQGSANILARRSIQDQAIIGVVLIIERRTLICVVDAASGKKAAIRAVGPAKQGNNVVTIAVGGVQNPDLHEPVNAVGRGLVQGVETRFIVEIRRREIA